LSVTRAHNKCSTCCPVRMNALSRFLHSLIGRVSDILLQTVPDFNEALLQLIDTVHTTFIHSLLHNTPDLIQSTGFRFGLFGGQRSGPMKSDVSCCSSLMVSLARWDGALSCSKTNVSPATCLIADSICESDTAVIQAVGFYSTVDKDKLGHAHFRHSNGNHNWCLQFEAQYMIFRILKFPKER